MGQKTHPVGFRLGIIKTWDSRWFAGKNYAELLGEDIKIRRYLENRLANASLSKVVIQRAANKVTVNVATAKPGLVIGRRGAQVDLLRDELKHLTKKEVYINIDEIKKPDTDASLVAQNIARQLEGRVSFRRASSWRPCGARSRTAARPSACPRTGRRRGPSRSCPCRD